MHHLGLVFTDTTDEREIEDLLAPYDQNLDADPWWRDEPWMNEPQYRATLLETASRDGHAKELYQLFLTEKPEIVVEVDGTPFSDWLIDYSDGQRVAYIKDEDKFMVEVTWNTNGEWDYWSIGGRWDGYLRTKKGEEVSQCNVTEVDIDYMFNDELCFRPAFILDDCWVDKQKWDPSTNAFVDMPNYDDLVRGALLSDKRRIVTVIDIHS